jgi:hypothetical protein
MRAETPGTGRLLVVGGGSFIAGHFLAACEEPVRAVGHDAIERPDLLDGVDRVISFARHSLLGSAIRCSGVMSIGPRPWTRMCAWLGGSPGATSTT